MKKYLVLLSFLCCGSLAAQNAPEASTFEDMDDDGDKYISKQESSNRGDVKKNFERIDVDKNGKLDISEFSAFESEGKFVPPDMEIHEPGAAPF